MIQTKAKSLITQNNLKDYKQSVIFYKKLFDYNSIQMNYSSKLLKLLKLQVDIGIQNEVFTR